MLSLEFTAHSEVGRVRKNNQDAAYASATMLVVCDGMGGAAAGDLASAVAASEASRSDRRLEDPEDLLAAIAGIIHRANNRLGELVEEDLSIDGMGTTFCGAMFNGKQFAVGHIGDSRGYLLRNGNLTQITHDHSWVQSLIDEGKITPAQAATHPHRSLILKVLNGQEGFDPDLFLIDAQVGDKILFCSDGLSGLVSDEEIAEELGGDDLDVAVERLAQLANKHGGYDNITVAAATLVEQDDVLDAKPGSLYGSATEVEIPAIGELAAKSGKPSGYPDHPRPVEPAKAPDQAPEETARYAPTEGHRRVPTVLIVLIAIALAIGGGAWGLQSFTQSRYFIASESGRVAIYNGLPGSLLGMPLSRIAESTNIEVSDLPAFHRRAVNNTIAVADLAAGRATAQELRELADQCVAARQARLKPAGSVSSSSPTPTSSQTTDPLPTAPGGQQLAVEPGYPTHLAPMTPSVPAEADPESC